MSSSHDVFLDRIALADAVRDKDWERVSMLSQCMVQHLDDGSPPQGIGKIGMQPLQGAPAHAKAAVERFHRALAGARERERKRK
jgi:hypothetical protein